MRTRFNPWWFFGAAAMMVALAGTTRADLLTDLAEYLKLDETSGDRTGEINGNVFADTNTVTSTTGKLNTAAQFTAASSERLIAPDSDSLSCGADTPFTWTMWVYMDTEPRLTFVSKYGGGATETIEILIECNGSDRFRAFIGNGTSHTNVVSDTFGNISTATWYFLVVWHDPAANTFNIQVNNTTADSVSWSGGTQNTAHDITLGSRNGFDFMNGRLDGIGFWKRVLTADEKTQLYNSGNGYEGFFISPRFPGGFGGFGGFDGGFSR